MAGSRDKTLKLYYGHFHELLNDIDKEVVMNDIKAWVDAHIPAVRTAAPAFGCAVITRARRCCPL